MTPIMDMSLEELTILASEMNLQHNDMPRDKLLDLVLRNLKVSSNSPLSSDEQWSAKHGDHLQAENVEYIPKKDIEHIQNLINIPTMNRKQRRKFKSLSRKTN